LSALWLCARQLERSPTFCACRYLTSSSLLDLQLSDARFRRHVLLQMLICFQTLESEPSVTPKPVRLVSMCLNISSVVDDRISMIGRRYDETITQRQTSESNQRCTSVVCCCPLVSLAQHSLAGKKVYTLLRATKPGGAAFVEAVHQLLAREVRREHTHTVVVVFVDIMNC
jgi:hypothetical protein